LRLLAAATAPPRALLLRSTRDPSIVYALFRCTRTRRTPTPTAATPRRWAGCLSQLGCFSLGGCFSCVCKRDREGKVLEIGTGRSACCARCKVACCALSRERSPPWWALSNSCGSSRACAAATSPPDHQISLPDVKRLRELVEAEARRQRRLGGRAEKIWGCARSGNAS